MNATPEKPDAVWRLQRLAMGVDLEEFQPRSGPAGAKCTALPELIGPLLDLLATHDVLATFFTVGRTARKFPGLVRELSARGHEIASHGHEHRPLDQLDPATFAEDLARSLETLNALSQSPVTGFRAPLLSLTGETSWAYDVLRRAGIRYSSSTFPAANVQYGWPGSPAEPHTQCGVREYPITVMQLGGRRFPAVGGAYFRIFPRRFVFGALRKRNPDDLVTSYFHPYDYDVAQPFTIHRELVRKPWLAPLLFYNRGDFLERLRILLDHTNAAHPFGRYYAMEHEGST